MALEQVSYRKEWTSIQIEAFTNLDQSLVISAGAGSGKTSVLVERFLNLIEKGYRLSEILAVTFTDKAAAEMKQRVFESLKARRSEGSVWARAFEDLQALQISTIHSFCSRLLKENALAAGVDPTFRLLDQVQMEMVQEEILESLFEVFSKEERFFAFFKEYDPQTLSADLLRIYGQCRGRGDKIYELKISPEFDIRKSQETLEQCVEEYQSLAEKKMTPVQSEIFENMNEVLQVFSKIENSRTHEVLNLLDLLKSKSTRGALNQVKNQFKEAFENYCLYRLEKEHHFKKEIFQELIKNFHYQYQDFKKEKGVLDYEDLLLQAKYLLTSASEMARAIQIRLAQQFKAVMIDEMQDTNPLQFEIFKALEQNAPLAAPALFYVGDLKQSIYRFRHADLTLFQTLIHNSKADQARQKFLGMDTNFRSTSAILNFVNFFFGKIWQTRPGFFEPLQPNPQIQEAGQKPQWAVMVSGPESSMDELRKKEAAWVAGQIETLIATGEASRGEIAILLRSTFQAAFYENALKARGLSYQVVRAKGFFDQSEVQDLFHFLKVLNDPGDSLHQMALLRSPLFGVSDQTLLEIGQHRKISSGRDQTRVDLFWDLYEKFNRRHSHLGLANILRQLLAATGYDAVQLGKHAGLQRYNNIQNFIAAVAHYEKTESPSLKQLVHYLEKLKHRERFESEGTPDPAQRDHIQILTIHSAKGLEFPVVFVCDLGRSGNHREDADFCYEPLNGLGLKIWDEFSVKKKPLYTHRQIREQENAAELEELKRLYYVAFTRAKKRLFLTSAYKPPKKEKEDALELASVVDWLPEIFPELQTWLQPEEQNSSADSPVAESIKEFPEVVFIKPSLEKLKVLKKNEIYLLQKIYDTQTEALVLNQLPQAPVTKLKPMHLAATQYALLPYCPRAFGLSRLLKNQGHYFKSEESEPIGELAEWQEIPAADHHDISNAFLGKLVHQVVSQLSAKTPDPEWRQNILAKQEILSSAEDQKLLGQCIQHYRQSPYAQIADQGETLREQNFMVQLGRHQLRGTIDLAFKENGKWVVVDYKTSQIQSEAHRQWLRRYYFGQLQAYAYALEKITGLPVAEARLVFLSDLREEKWSASELNLAGLTSDLIESGFQKDLRREAENCSFCHFNALCNAS